ncbi:acyltransferase family protein [Bradyrhizobium sp. CSA112]|uniref:acyltransferase family protein n=1 Tax=Bradyrhizobium sp. CSA112 TaxID=2699170 RepID=UPI0023B04B3B|nr:acyltransferase [Bradyrhizobium sp. CSA112]MDE5458139.1 acyltransferase family protein [Bradyrhizobium sp. CSA112]
MLRKTEIGNQAKTASIRLVALDRARTFITLLVLIHHAAVNYTHFGNGDKMRWLGFDLVVLFNDSFFMACMFLISGLFVHDSLTRKGAANFLRNRAWRLGIPFLVSIFVLMPIAYYPTFLRYHLPGTTDFNFFHFWWRTLTVGPWPSGPAWFLWVLLALDAIAATLWALGPRLLKTSGLLIFSLRDQPRTAFVAFLVFSIAVYVPMRLIFGDASWLEPGGYPLPIQTSRILLYAGYFLTGVGIGVVSLRAGILSEDGELAKRWPVWLAFSSLFYGAILLLVYAHHNWIADFDSPPLSWQIGYSLAFALFSAAMTFTVLAVSLSFAASTMRLLDAMRPQAYGIFLTHYIFVIWLQYAVYDYSWPAFAKFAAVFFGTLALSWAVTLLLRKIPAVARMI